MVEEVTDNNYEEFRQSPAAVVAYGLASCEPCAQYDPVLEKIASQFNDVRVGKAKMHIPGQCREIKKRHRFETYPTTHLFSNGRLVISREGKLDEEELTALINDHLPRLDRPINPGMR